MRKIGDRNFDKKFDDMCKAERKRKKKEAKNGNVPIIIKWGFWIAVILLLIQIAVYSMNYLHIFLEVV